MNTGNITLTPADKQILNSYCHLLDGLSSYLGDGYEMVLHSLEDYEHSAIKVINGYHTDRTEGAPITNMALSLLAQMHDGDTAENGITYFSKNAKKVLTKRGVSDIIQKLFRRCRNCIDHMAA